MIKNIFVRLNEKQEKISKDVNELTKSEKTKPVEIEK
jgi:hypothetical protein